MFYAKTSAFEAWRTENLKGMAMSADIYTLIAKAFEGGQKAECEECAKVCEIPWQGHPHDIARQIRERWNL